LLLCGLMLSNFYRPEYDVKLLFFYFFARPLSMRSVRRAFFLVIIVVGWDYSVGCVLRPFAGPLRRLEGASNATLLGWGSKRLESLIIFYGVCMFISAFVEKLLECNNIVKMLVIV
jgi:hypothetical protein